MPKIEAKFVAAARSRGDKKVPVAHVTRPSVLPCGLVEAQRSVHPKIVIFHTRLIKNFVAEHCAWPFHLVFPIHLPWWLIHSRNQKSRLRKLAQCLCVWFRS